jgi:glutathione synthase/RimK-type ligase-like ATP-grasp enzyme
MPTPLLVLENPKGWDLELSGVEVVAARAYLTEPRYASLKRATVFNLCRTMGYQSLGYYVSLLAAARGHRPLPSVSTLQDLRMSPILRIIGEELRQEVQRALSHIQAEQFTLSIYFGRNMAKRYDRLCQALFAHFPAPFLRAELVKGRSWRLDSLRTLSSADIPESHRPFVVERAKKYFARPLKEAKPVALKYDLAILSNPEEKDCPSGEHALRKFAKAAEQVGMRPWFIGRDDYPRIAEFDGLFIRETTSVDHHTYRFARRAQAEGLVVIDDPLSIIRCTNKVYLAELFQRHGIPAPKSRVIHRENAKAVAAELGYPLVLKRPDSSFSRGVVKANDEAELRTLLDELLEDSELVVAQEFVRSDFDWRVGLIGGKPLYACKYHMSRGHWQIVRNVGDGEKRLYGKTETLPLETVPAEVLRVAEASARLIGDGLYGVDIKQVAAPQGAAQPAAGGGPAASDEGRFLVIEVNDNPSIDVGYEDAVIGDELYLAIMRTFAERIEARGRGVNRDVR